MTGNTTYIGSTSGLGGNNESVGSLANSNGGLGGISPNPPYKEQKKLKKRNSRNKKQIFELAPPLNMTPNGPQYPNSGPAPQNFELSKGSSLARSDNSGNMEAFSDNGAYPPDLPMNPEGPGHPILPDGSPNPMYANQQNQAQQGNNPGEKHSDKLLEDLGSFGGLQMNQHQMNPIQEQGFTNHQGYRHGNHRGFKKQKQPRRPGGGVPYDHQQIGFFNPMEMQGPPSGFESAGYDGGYEIYQAQPGVPNYGGQGEMLVNPAQMGGQISPQMMSEKNFTNTSENVILNNMNNIPGMGGVGGPVGRMGHHLKPAKSGKKGKIRLQKSMDETQQLNYDHADQG